MADFTKFDVNDYGTVAKSPGPGAYGEQDLATKGMIIKFTHVPSGNVIAFKAFITAFNETYNSDWAAESVYGRADPIMLFKNTTRKIALAFKVPAMTTGEAYENLGKVQMLTQFLYPTYADTGLAQTITQSPLVRIQVMNLLQDANGVSNTGGSAKELYNEYNMGANGLLGAIGNVTINHNLEGDIGVVEKGTDATLKALLPKMIEVNLDFSPIHEHPLGWSADENSVFGQFGEDNEVLFPYGVKLLDTSDSSAATDAAEEAQGKDSENGRAEGDSMAATTSEEQAPDPDGAGADATADQVAAQESEFFGGMGRRFADLFN